MATLRELEARIALAERRLERAARYLRESSYSVRDSYINRVVDNLAAGMIVVAKMKTAQHLGSTKELAPWNEELEDEHLHGAVISALSGMGFPHKRQALRSAFEEVRAMQVGLVRSGYLRVLHEFHPEARARLPPGPVEVPEPIVTATINEYWPRIHKAFEAWKLPVPKFVVRPPSGSAPLKGSGAAKPSARRARPASKSSTRSKRSTTRSK